VEDAQPDKPPSVWEDRPSVISIENATFSWNGDQQVAQDPQDVESRSPAPGPTLSDVTLNIKEGQLVCIVGPVRTKGKLLQSPSHIDLRTGYFVVELMYVGGSRQILTCGSHSWRDPLSEWHEEPQC
jgi:hypothetical protein